MFLKVSGFTAHLQTNQSPQNCFQTEGEQTMFALRGVVIEGRGMGWGNQYLGGTN